MPDKHNDTFDTGEYNWNGEVNPSASSPNFGKLTTTSFSTISRGFTDAIKWLKSEPKDDFTTDEIEQVEQAMKAAKDAKLAEAVDIMEAVKAQQDVRGSRGIRRRIARVIWRKPAPTIASTLLAQLLNARAVERINGASAKIKDIKEEDIMRRLRTSGGHGVDDSLAETLFLQAQTGFHLAKQRELDRIERELLRANGACDFCNHAAVGTMGGEGGKAWKLCAGHSGVARGMLNERMNSLQAYVDVMDEERKNLERAHELGPKDPTISKNLDYVRKTLAELSSRITPTETRKHLHVKTGKRSARIIPWITSFLREYVLPFMIIGALLGIIYVVTHIPWWISVIAGGAIGIGLGIWALVRYVSASSPFLDFYKKKW